MSFGVPFAEGTVKKGEGFTLVADGGGFADADVAAVAYWPDGSMKWWWGLRRWRGPGVKVGPVEVDAGSRGGSDWAGGEGARMGRRG